MRYITIPAPKPPLPPQFTFAAWLGWYVDSEPRLQRTHTAARAAQRVLEALDKAQDGVLELRDEDHALLSKLLLSEDEPPACGLAPAITITPAAGGESRSGEIPARLVLPYLDAIATAGFERPKKPEPLPEFAEKAAE